MLLLKFEISVQLLLCAGSRWMKYLYHNGMSKSIA